MARTILALLWFLSAAPVLADGLPWLRLASHKPKPTPKPSLDERFLFQPTRFPTGDWDHLPSSCREVTFTSDDGTKLYGWFAPVRNPVATVLYCHGNGGNISYCGEWLQKLQAEKRITVLIFDYRGYGKSEGKPTVEGALADAAAAREELAWLTETKPSDIVLWGTSLGGAVTIQLAADERPRGLILESTFSSFREVADYHQPALSWLVPKDRLNSARTIESIRCPLLQCHGTADRVIPFEQGEKLHAAATSAAPKTFIRLPKLGHNDQPTEEYDRALTKFLRTLPPPPPSR